MDYKDYLPIFLDESKENLVRLNKLLLELESKPDNQELLNEIFRIAHTIKGMSATMGFNNMATLTHNMENILDDLRKGKLKADRDIINLLFFSFDALEKGLELISTSGNDDSPLLKEAIDRFSNKDKIIESRTVSKEGSSSKVTLDQYNILVIKEAIQKGFNVFEIHVKLRENTVLKSVRAYMVFKVLEEKGEIVYSEPSVTDLENEKFDLDFTVVFITKETVEAIREPILQIAEIESVDITPISIGEKIEVKKEESVSKVQEAIVEKEGTRSLSKMGQTIRIDVERLDELMNLVGELVIQRTRLAQIKEFDSTTDELARITNELQNLVMKVRMIPIEQVFNRFPRMVRDLSQESGKKVRLEIYGADTELDKTVVDAMGDPLMHLIRNAIDHGIEPPEERIRLGKQEEGLIRLSAYHEGNNIYIEVEDDGAGINIDKVKRRAIEKGLITEEIGNRMSDEDVYNLLFIPGFSTSEKVTDISGRGVGMDVVKRRVEELNGTIKIESKLGRGTKVTIRLPLTLAIIQSLLVKTSEEIFAIPLSNIEEIVKLEESDIKTVKNVEVLYSRGRVIPLYRLSNVLGLPSNKCNFAVIVRTAGKQIGIAVDDLIGEEEIVIKSIDKMVNSNRNFVGATILGNGKVALILDVNTLASI
ncbi:MAG: chemotaxis protein CheA [bacterium]|nr:chemotaxis protein CheA [bacterium]